MGIIHKEKFEISKITGPYQLLAAFLIVFEGLLGFWLHRAENSTERVAAGILMTLTFFAFFYVVMFMKREENKPIIPPGLEYVTPAEYMTTEKEIDSPEPQRIAAPDGSYSINKSPDDWVVRELTLSELINENLKISDPSIKENTPEAPAEIRNILLFKSIRETFVTPITGRTIIDGRKFPSALSVYIPTQLSIIPIDRSQPPLFVERPLEHNFLTTISQIATLGLATLHDLSSGEIPGSKLRYMKADFLQEIKEAIVDGKEGKSVNSNIIFIGIEGELQDHILMLNYPSIPEADNPELERDLQILQSLVNSFRPLRIIDPDNKRKELQKKADESFRNLMIENGEDFFNFEFGVLLHRLKILDMDNLEQRYKAINMLKPFEIFARKIKLKDEDLNSLWNSLHEAEKGNASDFISFFKELLEEIEEGNQDRNAIPTAEEENDKIGTASDSHEIQ